MDPNITIYNSYRKGLNTIIGSFPVYSNLVAKCITNKNIMEEVAANLSELDELYDFNFLIQQFEEDSPQYDPYTSVGLLIDINSLTINSAADEEIYTFNLVI